MLYESQPHPARIYDCLLGGKDNYTADRAVAEELARRWPDIQQGARDNRAWMHRAVRHLVAEEGVTQFLDIGTGIPTRPNLHEVAQQADPASKVVYADNDPVVLRHAEALLASHTRAGRTAFVQADLRDPHSILESRELLDTLDLTQPVGLMLSAVLHFLDDEEDPYGVVAALLAALPPGSCLALSHACGDAAPESAAEASVFYRERGVSKLVVARSQQQIEDFFNGLDLREPGVVPVAQWRPEDQEPAEATGLGFRAGLARMA